MTVVTYTLVPQKLQKNQCLCVRKHLLVKVLVSVVASLLLASLVVGLIVGLSFSAHPEDATTMEAYTNAAISTDAGQCASVGISMLKKNGSAVDSAIATLLCMGVVNPHSMGLGGGFLMTIYQRDEKFVKVLEAREMAPLKATGDMFEGNQKLAREGGLSIGVPGELPGYVVVWQEYGKLSWTELFQPAIEMCENGFLVEHQLARALALNKEVIQNEPSLRKFFWNNNTDDVYKENERMRRPVLAQTLRTLSQNSTITKFFGELEETLPEEIRSFGGIITKTDFLKYTPHWKELVRVHLRNNLTLYSVPPPGSGALLGFVLNILDEYKFDETSFPDPPRDAKNYHRLVETYKHAFSKLSRLEVLEDGDDSFKYKRIKHLIKKLLSKEFAQEIQRNINDQRTYKPVHYGVETFHTSDTDTSHLSIVAPNGDAVSVSSSINSHFGSKRASISTGIIFNNAMNTFTSLDTSDTNGFPTSIYNKISPEKRPLSSMSPTIVVDSDGEIRLVIGGTGDSKITTGTAFVTMLNLWAGKDISQAINAPRIHHQLFPNIIEYESNFSKVVLEGLKLRGHEVQGISGTTSGIVGIARAPTGKLYASADYRRGGKTDGF
ncbi:scoloptoxin SSD14-like [Tachypleus tridentatus]|uniref:scoloptoxin SSD14-like n=1 Tax=Tachypleus tridentatus TaxID=6853 RepID=UPI003FD0555E